MYCFLCFSLSHLDCVSDFPSTSKQPRAPQLRSQLLHLLSLQVGTTFPSSIDFQLLDNLVVVKHWHMILHCSAEIRRAFVSLFKQCSGVFKGKQALSESAWTIWWISSLRMAGSNYYRHGHLTVDSARQGCYQKSMQCCHFISQDFDHSQPLSLCALWKSSNGEELEVDILELLEKKPLTLPFTMRQYLWYRDW